MAETFKLPCSSYEELIKLFQATVYKGLQAV